MKKTLIAVPCMDQVPAQFAQSLAMLQKEGPTTVAFQIGSLIYTSRNNLAAIAINQETDYIFWLDSDMMFPPGVLRHMLKVIQEQEDDVILSGVYYRRVAPFSPVVFSELDLSGPRQNGRTKTRSRKTAFLRRRASASAAYLHRRPPLWTYRPNSATCSPR